MARHGPRKLLAFDSWTEGNHHYQRLVDALEQDGFRLKLVHLGSWGNEPERPKEEIIGRLEVADISAYPGESFEAVLDVEKPDAVVMLSTATFAHRAFLRYCAKRSIPTLHLYHGLMSVQVTEDHVGSVKVNKLAHLAYVMARARKLITKTFPCYIGALLKTRGGPEDWGRFAYDVAKLAAGFPIWQPNVARDARTTKCAVFNEVDRLHANRVYRLAMNDVVAVGNPDLIRFGMSEDMLGSFKVSGKEHRTEVVYIDTGLVMQGLVYRDVDDFCAHLVETGEALGRQGYTLAVKLHPAHDASRIASILSGSGIRTISDEEFTGRLLASAGCIAEPSSATLIPALLGLPLLLAKYGRLAEVRFGQLLMAYPRSTVLTDLADVDRLLRVVHSPEHDRIVSSWIRENSGPMPADEMPRRVSKLVCSMVDDKTQQVRRTLKSE
jgi:hypothetical protein